MELLEKDFENLTEEEKQIYVELESVKRKIKKSLKKQVSLFHQRITAKNTLMKTEKNGHGILTVFAALV